MSAIRKSVYRSLLRAARLFDANPALKGLLAAPPQRAADPAQVALREHALRFFGGRETYSPTASLVVFVRTAARASGQGVTSHKR